MINLSRRRFLFTAPAIVAVSSIMPISIRSTDVLCIGATGVELETAYNAQCLGLLGQIVHTQHEALRITRAILFNPDGSHSVATRARPYWHDTEHAVTMPAIRNTRLPDGTPRT